MNDYRNPIKAPSAGLAFTEPRKPSAIRPAAGADARLFGGWGIRF